MLNTLSQFITSNKRDGTRYMPFAFIELGVAMLSSILNSEVVIEINKRLYRRSQTTWTYRDGEFYEKLYCFTGGICKKQSGS